MGYNILWLWIPHYMIFRLHSHDIPMNFPLKSPWEEIPRIPVTDVKWLCAGLFGDSTCVRTWRSWDFQTLEPWKIDKKWGCLVLSWCQKLDCIPTLGDGCTSVLDPLIGISTPFVGSHYGGQFQPQWGYN
jgi:hypothetical protein